MNSPHKQPVWCGHRLVRDPIPGREPLSNPLDRLVATLGKGGQRKLNRKNIQDVNVPKACEKIIHPGAPLALRLQSNLLYGVSRVFSHQCAYVLSDAECVQSEMLSYFRTTNPNEIIDSRAGKAK